MDVIAIFDIGKTNKKLLLFDGELKLVYQKEQVFEETVDDEGFACDDIVKLETWMKNELNDLLNHPEFTIRAINFTTYGASLMYLDGRGKVLTPVYNYLKPMPEGVLDGFYERYGGRDEFCRATASPALGMLNSGLQVLWLKKKKPEIFARVSSILHFSQYMSYLFTRRVTSELTSIGCHTAMWDFDNHRYHRWLVDEGIRLPDPEDNANVVEIPFGNDVLKAGIGIHDSSSSLVPYIKTSHEPFILISTGTWCIFMNPFNHEPLTREQLQHDTLCYMSIQQQQVKSSRLFLGRIHDDNLEHISRHFGEDPERYKQIVTDTSLCRSLQKANKPVFFRENIPAGIIDHSVDLKQFEYFEDAYHQLVFDLVSLAWESMQRVVGADDPTRVVYITGGFSRNKLFTGFLASRLVGKKVYTSEIDNATALGAAMVVYEKAFGKQFPVSDLGLKRVKGF